MDKIGKLVNPSCDNVFEHDNTFPIQFCPVCGSEHLTGQGRKQPLFNCKESWLIICYNCGWELELFITKQGKKKFKFRQDSANCHKCHEFYDGGSKTLTDHLKKLINFITKDKNNLMVDNDIDRLQCGWEDICGEKNCHKCPLKYKITIELTEAEVCAIEDCAMVDLPQHAKEKPKVYALTQEIMMDLMRKVFKLMGE